MGGAKWLVVVVLLGVFPAVALASQSANKHQSAALYRPADGGCALKGKMPQGVIKDFRLC